MWGISLSREHGKPLKRQIYEELKSRILDGRIKANEALPSTRELSKNLGISRSTVGEAYDMLISEGYVVSRQGAPTRVAEGLCIERLVIPPARPDIRPAPELKADFHTGRPDLRQFPQFLWRQLLHKAAEDLPLEQYGYTGPRGIPALRAEIAAWLMRSRGLLTDPDHIFITAGATHALHLLAELLCGSRKQILMEDPCHSGMLRTFLQKQCLIIPVPADFQGLRTDLLPSAGDTCAVYVTPSHQFPLGGILPASRRAALIRYARENDLYIIEDDYDSEFRYCGEPVAPLCAMDPQRVIYVGTFSKILFPALRIGYVILPGQLHQQWETLRTHSDVQNPPFEQAALAHFLRTGKLERHIRNMRKLYGYRREVLLDTLRQTLHGSWTACGDAAGLHMTVDFPGMRFEDAFRKYCLRNGIYITPMEKHCIVKGRHESKLLLGYGHLDPDEIKSGVRLLSGAIDRLKQEC